VAQLCGLSITWYTWLEQGREISVSPAALARLAVALRLGRAERAYLFELARKRDPDQDRGEPERLPAVLSACVEAIVTPAYVLDRSWTARRWNMPAEKLFAGWLDQPGERNLLRFIFLQPAARSLIADWETRARRVAAEFRAACSTHLDAPALRELIARLRRESPEFAGFWDQHRVLGRDGGARTFNHPTEGFLRFEQVTFDLAGLPDLKLTILIQAAAGAATWPEPHA
jgi:transcriptional regulator with XRE-family HTH domain